MIKNTKLAGKIYLQRAMLQPRIRLEEVPPGISGIYFIFDHSSQLKKIGEGADIASSIRRHASGDDSHAISRHYMVGALAKNPPKRAAFIRCYCRVSFFSLGPDRTYRRAIKKAAEAEAISRGHSLNGSHRDRCTDDLEQLIEDLETSLAA